MDITATNYDPSAEISGLCNFENTTLDIYNNGSFSSWGENDFVFLSCQGSAVDVAFDADNQGLALVADGDGNFFGFIQTLNVNEGRYFATADSKLNFDARLANSSTSDTVNVFIRGQEPETVANCQDIFISDRVMLPTSSLTTTPQPVSLNLQGFGNIFLQNVGIVAGFEFQANPFDTLMVINNVNWTNF